MMQTATATKPPKVYVAVKADFAADGTMFPRIITWEDGEKYEIDRVSDIRQAPALKAGGQGDRYTIWIGGHQSYRAQRRPYRKQHRTMVCRAEAVGDDTANHR